MHRFLLLLLGCIAALSGFCRSLQLPGRACLIEGITYKQTPQGPLAVDVFLPDSASTAVRPVFLFIHGGSWMELTRSTLRTGFRKVVLDSLLCAGYAVVSVDYRLVKHDGSVAYPAPLSDCKDAVRWIRREAARYHFNPQRIAVGGCSAGGHLAMLTAYTPDEMGQGETTLSDYSARVNCCIDIYGPTYLGSLLHPNLVGPPLWLARLFFSKNTLRMREALLQAFTHESGRHPLRRKRACRFYSPLEYASGAVPTLILHGNKDRVVPFSQAKRLRKALEKASVSYEWVPLAGEDHSFPTLTSEGKASVAAHVRRFADAHLR